MENMEDVNKLLAEAAAIVNASKQAQYTELDAKTGELVSAWFDLNKEVKRVSDELKRLKAEQEALELHILDKMDMDGLDKISTSKGTMSVSVKMAPNVNDQVALITWINEDLDNRIGFLTKSISSKAVEELYTTEGVLPPGVSVYNKVRLNKRSK